LRTATSTNSGPTFRDNQETLKRDPHSGRLFVFRGRHGGLIKVLWHDGRGRFIWPSPADGVVTISAEAQ
jgi:transposase